MSDRKVEHGSFVIERLIDAPPSRVYAAFSTAEGKERWLSGPKTKVQTREFDFRVGGRERLFCEWAEGTHPNLPGVRTSDFRAEYLDIVPGERIVYVYEMYLGESKISV